MLNFSGEGKTFFKRFLHIGEWDKVFSNCLLFICCTFFFYILVNWALTPLGGKIDKEVMATPQMEVMYVATSTEYQETTGGNGEEGKSNNFPSPMVGLWHEGMKYLGYAFQNYDEVEFKRLESICGIGTVKKEGNKIKYPIGFIPGKYRSVPVEEVRKKLQEYFALKKQKGNVGGIVRTPRGQDEFDYMDIEFK